MNNLNLLRPGKKTTHTPRLDWLNPLKAFALLAILLNHLVEEFGGGSWFTNPSNHWPDFSTRMGNIVPEGFPHPFALLQFLGWLGDSAPGVFILVSGIGLTWSALHRTERQLRVGDFYLRRLGRIYPLYITMHFIFLAGAVFVPANLIRKASSFSYALDSPYTLLSMLGLRCTDSLFFGFISPSWWFVWLILQLYLVFPLLYILLQRVGVKQFLLFTCSFTFAVRLLGISCPQFLPYSLFNWMTGIFFGTRLAEFSAGMAIAVLLAKHAPGKLSAGRVFCLALPLYLMGLACSFTWPGTVVSNLFVTLGMSGLFYALWQGCLKTSSVLTKIFIWMGVHSYAVYLFHQPPLKMTSILPLSMQWHLIAAIAMVVISFPVAWLIEKVETHFRYHWERATSGQAMKLLSFICLFGAVLLLLVIDQFVGWQNRLVSFTAGLLLLFLCLLEYASHGKEKVSGSFFRWFTICALSLKLFFFSSLLGTAISLVLGLAAAILSKLFYRIAQFKNVAQGASVLVVLLCIVVGELALKQFAPLSVGKWGELPALEQHPTRTYALKPNVTIHLKYNNYDYVIRTNSLGLASPEITIQRPVHDTQRILVLGDAFSMPEGLEYKNAFPALLEENLAKQISPGSIQVINGGVTGYGPMEEYNQLRELGPLLRPNIVVYQFYVNEFGQVNDRPEKRLQEIGLVSSNNLEQLDLLERSQIIRHAGELAYVLVDFLWRNYAEASVLIDNASAGSFRFLEKITGGWRYRNSHLRYYRIDEDKLYDTDHINKLRYYLDAMQKICREIGAKFVIYFVPAAVAVSSPEDNIYFPLDQDLTDRSVYNFDLPLLNLKKVVDPLGIDIVDLTPFLKQHPKQPVYFPASWHWNKEGHRVAAEVIARNLTTKGYFNDEH